MKPYSNRDQKIADGQFDDQKWCDRVTKVQCSSDHKKRILRPFKKSMRQKLKNIKEVIEDVREREE